MAEPKEIHPLDELFRKSFDELPAAPATNGWDTPSVQVWEHVQERIKTPRTSWKSWTIAILAAVATVAALWFWFQNRPTPQPAAPPQTMPQEQPGAQPQTAPADAATTNTDAETGKTTSPVSGKGKKQTAPAKPQPATEADPLPGSNQTLPAAKKVFPNNTERNKRQDADGDGDDDKTPSKPLPNSGGERN
jgi:cytoskeletal protein RodZ